MSEWQYKVQRGPEGEEGYAWLYDGSGNMVATMKTHKAAQIADAMNSICDKASKEPCGECHLNPGEECDICHAIRPPQPSRTPNT